MINVQTCEFLIKQAAKIDQLLVAGKLSRDAWNRYAKSLFPRNRKMSHILNYNPNPYYRQGVFKAYDRARKLLPSQPSISAKDGDRILGSAREARRKLLELEEKPTYRTGWMGRSRWNELTDPTAYVVPKGLPKRVNSKPRVGLRASVILDPDSSKRPWANPAPGKYPTYVPDENLLLDARPGTPVGRHELGHWAQYQMLRTNPERHASLMRSLAVKLRKSNPQLFKQLIKRYSHAPLSEAFGHYLASRGGRGGARLRGITQQNWNSPGAERARLLYPNDPGVASTIEHMQRNYKIPGGNLIQ